MHMYVVTMRIRSKYMSVIRLKSLVRMCVPTRNFRARMLASILDCVTNVWGECTTAHVPCGCVCWDSFESLDTHALRIRLLRPCGNNRVFLAAHRIGAARDHRILVA